MSCSQSSVGAVEAVEAAIDLRRWSSWYKGAKTITARCHTDVCGRERCVCVSSHRVRQVFMLCFSAACVRPSAMPRKSINCSLRFPILKLTATTLFVTTSVVSH